MLEDLFPRLFVHPVPGRTLIVGSKIYGGKPDARAGFSDAVGVDLEPGEGVDHVVDMEKKTALKLGTFSHIVCCSVLEHSRRPWLMAANLEKLLEPGGSIYIHAPTVWRYHRYPDDYWRFTHAGIAALFPNIEWAVMKYRTYDGRLHDLPKIPQKNGRYSKTEIHAFGHAR